MLGLKVRLDSPAPAGASLERRIPGGDEAPGFGLEALVDAETQMAALRRSSRSPARPQGRHSHVGRDVATSLV